MAGYFKQFNENALMSFRINNKQLLKNYNKTWKKNRKVNKDKF